MSVTKRGKNSSFHFKSKVQATFLAECTCIRVNSSSDRDDAILENDHFLLPSQSRSQGSLYSSVWEGSSPVSLENRTFSRVASSKTLTSKGRQVTREFNGFALSLALTLFRPPGGSPPPPPPSLKS